MKRILEKCEIEVEEETMIRINLVNTERYVAMTPKTKKETPGVRRRRRLPKEYVCIAPEESPQVFDWLNGAGTNGDKEVAEVHLRLCFHCQESVARLIRIDEEFRNRARRCLHRTSSENEQSSEPYHDTEAETPKSMKARG